MTPVEEAYSPAGRHSDAAWLRIATSLPIEEVRAFLDDVERLYRINPLLDISLFERVGPARYHLVARNHSNGTDSDTLLAVNEGNEGLEIAYSRGLKIATRFHVAAAPGGSHLFVTDIYGGGSEDERRLRAGEVDLSLNAWGRGLHDYLRQWARWHRVAPWRWYMRRVWQPMKPSARRIVWMIWMASAFEMIAACGLLAVWVVMRRASA